jgi:hypothetical protein
MDIGEPRAGYTLRAEHPEAGTDIVENHPTMKVAIARAVELIADGYGAEIGSPETLLKPP